MRMYADVVLPIAGPAFYTYTYGDEISLIEGQIVDVSFRGKKEKGVVVKTSASTTLDEKKIKEITAITDYILKPVFMDFLKRMASYTLNDFGLVVKAALPQNLESEKEDLKRIYGIKKYDGKLTPIRKKIQNAFLSESEKLTLSQIMNRTQVSAPAIKTFLKAGGLTEETKKDFSETFNFSDFNFLTPNQKEAQKQIEKELTQKPVVLNGVTGSGKTEVYFSVSKHILESGKQVLILLPEIALTVQFLEKFEKRFGRKPLTWHSNVSASVKQKIWKKIYDGTESVVIGTRSALFLPFKNLGLIVVDEEHDGSYKQEDQMIYQARDMAVLRASIESAGIILASATPSFETLANVREGRYAEVVLSERVKKAVLPNITLIDLKVDKPEKQNNQKGWLSPKLVEALNQTFDRKRQAFLFLNRRGYAPLMICSKCGHRMKCPHCDVYMVYHQGTHSWLKCHQCDHVESSPKKCPQCGEIDSFALCGPGIERLEEEAKTRFPNQKILVLSSENTQTPNQLESALKKIENQEIDLIIGTQILAKGHHFPALSVVGIVDADMSLMGADFRAAEKTIQVLEQTSGRAGREGEQGQVFIQTYMPDHPVMQALKEGRKERFIQQELEARKILKMPPFGTLIALIVSGQDEQQIRLFCQEMIQKAPQQKEIKIYGPADAVIRYLRGKYRKRFLIQAPKTKAGHIFLKNWLEKIKIPSNIQIKIDVNPYNFM